MTDQQGVLEYRFEQLLGRLNAFEIIFEELACSMIRHGVDRSALMKEVHDGAMARARFEYASEIGFSPNSRHTARNVVEEKVRQMTANLNIRTAGVKQATARY